MIMKLELEHLAPYLPYELKIKFNISGEIGILEYINTKRSFAGTVEEESQTDEYYYCDNIENIKPILRPLSDLTKEIEVNGEKFYPLQKFGLVANKNNQEFFEVKIKEQWITFKEMQILISWHFDVFGLIENNLAIDINTLKS